MVAISRWILRCDLAKLVLLFPCDSLPAEGPPLFRRGRAESESINQLSRDGKSWLPSEVIQQRSIGNPYIH
jgi:hypothetical protein